MKNVLNYFVRKAFGFKSTATAEDKTLFGHLLRIRQNIQGVYDWLYGKVCGSADGTIPRYMPMTEAVTDPNDGHEVRIAKALNSDNLLAHLRLLDGRKISNGYADGTPADDGLPDGVSLARLLCDSTLQPTELIDDNIGWTANTRPAILPDKVVLGCKVIDWYEGGSSYKYMLASSTLTQLDFPNLEEVYARGINDGIINCPSAVVSFPALKKLHINTRHADSVYGHFLSKAQNEVLYLPNLESLTSSNSQVGAIIPSIAYDMPNLKEVYMPKMTSFMTGQQGAGNTVNSAFCFCLCPNIEKIVVGRLTSFNSVNFMLYKTDGSTMKKLIHFEIGEGTACNLPLQYWSPTLDSSNLSLFLSNFRQYLMLRLADSSSALKLTLSAGVYNAVTGAEDGLASTLTLGELGVELTEKEIAVGITLDTTYASWLDTYRAAIKWDIASV